MSVESMAIPLSKLKKIRSLDEVLTRGGQAFSAYREQRRGGEGIPTDVEFFCHIDASQFAPVPVIAETLWAKFYNNGHERFFPPFQDHGQGAAAFCEIFGESACNHFVAAAEKIVDGRIDLLGLKNLYVGTEIDWHREPVSAKRSPLKHWKQFDDLDTSETGNKKTIWELNRHQHFFTLGVAFWMTGDERFALTFARHLESWIEQNPPSIGINWSSSLEVSFRAMSWIWAFHFFRDSDYFTPDLFKLALKHIYRHGRHIERYLSKYFSPNTHLTGEGLGLYYLGTQFPFFDRAKAWRELGESILFAEIEKQLLPDGVYFEQSTWYQRYTVDFFSHFVILRTLHGEPYYNAAAAAVENRLQKAFDFMMQVTMPDGKTPLIGDDDGGRMLPVTRAAPDDFRGSLALASIIFDRGDYKYVSGSPSGEIFWLTGDQGIKSFTALTASEPTGGSAEFAQGGYAVMRDGWSNTDNCMIIDCGDLGSLSGGHGHADALSIQMAVHGKTLLVDSGTYTYHESREFRDYFRSSSAHNTLMVDGLSSSTPGNAFGWKTRAEAQRSAWICEDRFDLFEGRHSGYERLESPVKHSRSVLFLKGDYWIMRDLVETAGEHDYSLNFHFSGDARPEVSENGQWVGDDEHRLYTFGDNGSWHQHESWISNVHGNKMNAPFLRFISKGTGTQEFFTFILPVDWGVAPPEVQEVTTSSGRAFVIKYAGYTDAFVFNDQPGKLIKTGIFDSDFNFSWARMRDGEQLPDEFVLIDGGRLDLAGTVVTDSKVEHLSARRLGSVLNVKTDSGRTKIPLS